MTLTGPLGKTVELSSINKVSFAYRFPPVVIVTLDQ
jgi:hypothetical protein